MATEIKQIGGEGRPIKVTYGVIYKTATDLKLKNLSELDKLGTSDLKKFNDFIVNLYYYGLKAGAKSEGQKFTNSKEDVKEWIFEMDMEQLTDLEYFNGASNEDEKN